MWERSGGCRVDLAPILAQFRRNPREPETSINVFFCGARDPLVVLDSEETVLVQFQTEPDRAITERDVVGLRAGEILQRRAAAVRGHEPQIDLNTSAKKHTRLGVSAAQHAFDEAMFDEGIHDGRIRTGGEDIDVAAGVAAA